jgi:hypothetical protein
MRRGTRELWLAVNRRMDYTAVDVVVLDQADCAARGRQPGSQPVAVAGSHVAAAMVRVSRVLLRGRAFGLTLRAADELASGAIRAASRNVGGNLREWLGTPPAGIQGAGCWLRQHGACLA